MSSKSWGQQAKEAIAEACLMFADSYGMHPACFSRELTDDQKKKLVRMIDKCYPFGERSMWPYKAWLKERRVIIDWLYPKEPEPLGGLFQELS